jgi:hypothetical protein
MCITHPCQKGFPQRKNRARYLSVPDPVWANFLFLALHDIQLGGVYPVMCVFVYSDKRISDLLYEAMGHKKARNSLKLRAVFAIVRWLSNYLFN